MAKKFAGDRGPPSPKQMRDRRRDARDSEKGKEVWR
jgi:hypothetical protein